MSGVAPHAGIIDFGEFIPAAGGRPARPGSLPAPEAGEDGYVFTTAGWTDPALIGATFERVSKNLASVDFVLGYTSSTLSTLTYANGIIKTLNRTDGRLTSIVLSGTTPDGIDLTKTLTYTSGNLSAVVYT